MTYAAQTLDAHTPVRFNKFQWEDAFLAHRDRLGLHRASSLVTEFRISLGTSEFDCHVPVVWRKAKTLGESCGMTQPTYRKYRDQLTDAGFLFEVASGQGHRQTLKILKMPEWDELDALYVARRSLDAYVEREDRWNTKWVRDALTRAIVDTEAARSCADPLLSCGSEQMKDSFIANEKPFHLSPSIHGKTNPDSVAVEKDRNLGSPPDPTPPPPIDEGNSKRGVPEFGHVAALKSTLVGLFAEYGRKLDEGCAVKLGRVWAAQGATPETLQAALETKLMRLFAEGYRVGVVVRILMEDAHEFEVPAKPVISKPSPSKTREKTAEERAFAKLAERVSELEQAGVSFAQAVERAKAELEG